MATRYDKVYLVLDKEKLEYGAEKPISAYGSKKRIPIEEISKYSTKSIKYNRFSQILKQKGFYENRRFLVQDRTEVCKMPRKK